MLILSADLLLWLNAVTEDTIHQEIELEKGDGIEFSIKNSTENTDNSESAGRERKEQIWNCIFFLWEMFFFMEVYSCRS